MNGEVAVICVGIQGSSNVGAIARVMLNFGLKDLILVAPSCTIDSEANRYACHAKTVLQHAQVVPHLSDVLSNFHVIIGTTGNPAASTVSSPLPPAAIAQRLKKLKTPHHLAILFGPEDHGLSNQELKICRWVIKIPTSTEYPSMNISHAAAVIFYELSKQLTCFSPLLREPISVSVADMEQFYGQLKQVLLDVGFLHASNPERIIYTLRRILSRTGLNPRELKILRGILRQINWALTQAGQRFPK